QRQARGPVCARTHYGRSVQFGPRKAATSRASGLRWSCCRDLLAAFTRLPKSAASRWAHILYRASLGSRHNADQLHRWPSLVHLTTAPRGSCPPTARSEEHTSELQSRENLVCRLLLEKKNNTQKHTNTR